MLILGWIKNAVSMKVCKFCKASFDENDVGVSKTKMFCSVWCSGEASKVNEKNSVSEKTKQARYKHTAKNYRSGKLPSWMFS